MRRTPASASSPTLNDFPLIPAMRLNGFETAEQTVRTAGVRFRMVGVLKRLGNRQVQDGEMERDNMKIYIPLTTAQTGARPSTRSAPNRYGAELDATRAPRTCASSGRSASASRQCRAASRKASAAAVGCPRCWATSAAARCEPA